MFLPVQKRPALPEAQPQRRWAEETRGNTTHLATPAPQGEEPYFRQRSVPTMQVILPRRVRRTRRVAPRAAEQGFEFLYVSSGRGGLGAIFARVLRAILK